MNIHLQFDVCYNIVFGLLISNRRFLIAIKVSSISHGPYLLYAEFLHAEDEDTLSKSLWELVNEAVAQDDSGTGTAGTMPTKSGTGRSFLDLAVAVEDDQTSEEYDIPPVRLWAGNTEELNNHD